MHVSLHLCIDAHFLSTEYVEPEPEPVPEEAPVPEQTKATSSSGGRKRPGKYQCIS